LIYPWRVTVFYNYKAAIPSGVLCESHRHVMGGREGGDHHEVISIAKMRGL
jgi:hypothetical protein